MVKSFVFAFSSAAVANLLPGEVDWTTYTYEEFNLDFGKTHDDGRQQIFESNLATVIEHNSNPSKSYFMAVNKFADWTLEEFRAQRVQGTKKRTTARRLEAPMMTGNPIPDSLDWRDRAGVVTPVKNQGGCGSCWAFSTTQTLESAAALAANVTAPILSPQQIVSCSPNPNHCGGTGGCDGSTQELGFNYTISAGITTESSYPYQGVTGTCEQSKIKAVVQNDGFVVLPKNNYTALMDAVATVGPIAISVAAGSSGWQFYGGGVLTTCDWIEDHAVQLVGYGAESGKSYYLVRNSWGSDWGEAGYIKIQRFGEGKEPCGMDTKPGDGSACAGDDTPVNICGLCGILSDSSYPTGVKVVGPLPPPSPPSPPSPSPSPSPFPPMPSPIPTPTPTPTPGPVPPPSAGKCEDQESKANCLSTLDDASGKPCDWCLLSGLGIGICVQPGDTSGCNGEVAV